MPRATEITSDEDYMRAGEKLAVIVNLQGQVAETFDPIIKQQRAALETARMKRSGHMDPLLSAERALKRAMVDWLANREVPTIEATVTEEPEALVAPPLPPLSSVASVRNVWQFEVLDVELLRTEFRVPDLVKIGKVVRALGPSAVESVSKPGCAAIRVFETTTIAAKRK